jgi:hypothetical protein
LLARVRGWRPAMEGKQEQFQSNGGPDWWTLR